jgi:hypothetical protein
MYARIRFTDIVANVQSDLEMVKHVKQSYTPLYELEQIEALLQVLEQKLRDFHQILHRIDRSRGMVGFGGSILKTLIGTATVTNVHLLHGLLKYMRLKEPDMSHAVDNQLMYVKQLGTNTRINADAISNISTIIRDNIMQSSEQYQQVTRDILCLNVMLQGQNTLYISIRQIELTLQQLTNELEVLFDAVQCTIFGKLPVRLVIPPTLQGILTKRSPE